MRKNELRQAEVQRVLGEYLTRKLLTAGWIAPVRKDATGHIWFDQLNVHRAIKRLRSGGLELNGYARRSTVTPAKTKRDSLENLTIALDAELQRFSERETKTPSDF